MSICSLNCLKAIKVTGVIESTFNVVDVVVAVGAVFGCDLFLVGGCARRKSAIGNLNATLIICEHLIYKFFVIFEISA